LPEPGDLRWIPGAPGLPWQMSATALYCRSDGRSSFYESRHVPKQPIKALERCGILQWAMPGPLYDVKEASTLCPEHLENEPPLPGGLDV
jgi:hypothetical protein